MKTLIIFGILLPLSLSDKQLLRQRSNSISNQNLPSLISESEKLDLSDFHFSNELQQELENSALRFGKITAVINEYADKVFNNIQKLILKNGLDPKELPDQVLKLFPTGTISLSEGLLEDTATIGRYKDVSVSYSSTTKKMTFVVPVQFNDLKFIYKYHTNVLLLHISGDIQGKVTDVKANVKFSFDFGKYEASLDTFDIKDTGSISVTFSGNGLLDWITSSMTNVVSFFLHPVIIRIIEFIANRSLEAAVKTVNEAISNVLHDETIACGSYLV